MDNIDSEEKELKDLLEIQLKWCEKRDSILAIIEQKLYEMKEIAQYACHHTINDIEIKQLNGKLHELKNEVSILKKQLKIQKH